MLRLKEYELYLRENEIASKTIKNYMNTLKHLEQFCVENSISTLDKAAILDYKDFIKDGFPIYATVTKTGRVIPAKKYTVNTYNQKVGGLNAYLNWAELSAFTLKKQRQQSKSHKEFVSYREYQNLLRNLDIETQLLVMLIVNTGLRISEVQMIIKKNVYQESFDIDNKGTIRPVTINNQLKKEFKKFCSDMTDSELVFKRHETTYSRRLKKAAGLSRIKLERVHPHAFRHLFAVTFLKKGGDSLILQQLLGHKDSKTTAIYTEMSKDDQIEIFKKINFFEEATMWEMK